MDTTLRGAPRHLEEGPGPARSPSLGPGRLLVAGALILVTPSPTAAQAPPDTEVFLASLHRDGEAWSLEGIENITARPGYDNQPAFTPDGRFLLYTAVDEDGRADTWRYDLDRRRAAPVTRTPESEYSPTPIPRSDRFSAVRVERDSTQRLWSFAPDGSDPRLVLPDLRPVGYHAWSDAETVVVYVLGEPATLRVATPGGGHRTVARDVGRSLQRIPDGGRISFVDLAGADGAWITALDPQTGATERLAPALGESVDHAWTPDGVLLTGEGSTLYRWEGGEEAAWRPIADLADRGLEALTRLAVAPDGERIAVVAETDAGGTPNP